MPIDPGDILKLTFEVTLGDGTICQNVHYFRSVLVASVSEASALPFLELWTEDAYTELSGSLPSTMTQNVCTVQKIDWSAALSRWEVTALVGYFTPTIVFANAADELPNQSSAFASFNTARPKSRARTFVMPFGEDTQDRTILTAAALSDMVDFADQLLDGCYIDVLNYFIPGIPREAADVFLDLLVGVVTNVLGSQRRRRPGVGV